jgi:hypothetical protein
MEIGYRYRSAAVIPDPDEPDDGPLVDDPRELRGRPGTRAPHVELRGAPSTIDLFGRRFALVAGAEGEPWSAAADEAAQRVGVALDAHVLAEPQFASAYGVSPSGAALVRPDGFVAFRSRELPEQPAEELERALRSVLGQSSR